MFNFTDFARKIHDDRSRPKDEDPYILPALYGGELPPTGEGNRFRALVVLQNPLFTYTERQWGPPCATVEEAIRKHRGIFFSWLACNPYLDELFHHILVRMPATPEEFFQLAYVTDIWKDARNTEDVNRRKKEREHGHYWRNRLKDEIGGVAAAAEGVIFIGAEAFNAGFGFLRPGTYYRHFVFPASGHQKEFKKEFEDYKREGWKVVPLVK